MKIAESYPNGLKILWEKEKLIVTSNFSFSHSVFNRLVSQGRQKVSLCGNGLTVKVIAAVSDAHVSPGFLTPVTLLTQLFFSKPPSTFLTCFCRGERRKYAEKIFTSVGNRTHIQPVMSLTRSPLRTNCRYTLKLAVLIPVIAGRCTTKMCTDSQAVSTHFCEDYRSSYRAGCLLQ